MSSSTKGCIRLDGLFNIISYDVVPKLQNLLMASEFKVSIAHSTFFSLSFPLSQYSIVYSLSSRIFAIR